MSSDWTGAIGTMAGAAIGIVGTLTSTTFSARREHRRKIEDQDRDRRTTAYVELTAAMWKCRAEAMDRLTAATDAERQYASERFAERKEAFRGAIAHARLVAPSLMDELMDATDRLMRCAFAIMDHVNAGAATAGYFHWFDADLAAALTALGNAFRAGTEAQSITTLGVLDEACDSASV